MAGVKHFLLMITVVVLVGCGSTPRVVSTSTFDPTDKNHVTIEKSIGGEIYRYRLRLVLRRHGQAEGKS